MFKRIVSTYILLSFQGFFTIQIPQTISEIKTPIFSNGFYPKTLIKPHVVKPISFSTSGFRRKSLENNNLGKESSESIHQVEMAKGVK
ncbi:hypothetical protein GIB67_020535 [Kingdonia uniflora]|uniref:Uncharacterized protein n=1 Tax=Kingdonia uniflora TaxID=39325 RepID=A0A7J7NL95_9MAGN|nr:hypothetical protein GIB67_020535 [Kingdonia uniflora]